MKRTLTPSERNEIINLKVSDINSDLLKSYFAIPIGKDHPRFNTFDTFELPASPSYYTEKAITTTIGRFLFNLYVIPNSYKKKYGYQNLTFDEDAIKAMQSKMGAMILDNQMTPMEYVSFLNHGEWIGMNPTYYLVPSLTSDFIRPLDSVIKRRDELFEKHKDAIKKGDANVGIAIERELMDIAQKEVEEKNLPSYDLYKSKTFNFGNVYRKSSVLGSINEDLYTHKISILKSNYVDGIDPKEYSKFASLTVLGGYSRGVKTQIYGYESKKYNNSMQAVTLGEHDSDCGSTKFVKVVIHPKMKTMFLFRYIAENPNSDPHNLTLITEKNIDKFVGKEVYMRSPLFCSNDKVCNKCAGDLYYKIGLKNVGLLASNLTGSLLNLSMKSMHDSTIKFKTINIEDFIEER